MSTQKKSGWGSLLGSAVAGLESRLDTILAEDDPASARAKAADAAKQDAAKTAADKEKQRLQADQSGCIHGCWRNAGRQQCADGF